MTLESSRLTMNTIHIVLREVVKTDYNSVRNSDCLTNFLQVLAVYEAAFECGLKEVDGRSSHSSCVAAGNSSLRMHVFTGTNSVRVMAIL